MVLNLRAHRKNHSNKDCLKNRAFITIKNISQHSINEIVHPNFSGGGITFPSAGKPETDDRKEYSSQYQIEPIPNLTVGSALPNKREEYSP